jgi:transposase-like protein
MAHQEKISFKDFCEKFCNEEACREYLIRLRWPEGFICPKCGKSGGYMIKERNVYQCKHCRQQSSATAGTVMHHSRLPLKTWFWAIYLVSRDKRGYSATQLSSELGIAYSSAWYLLHRIRSAMKDRDAEYMLYGIVEVDDTYFGGSKGGGKRGRGAEKTKVLVAISKDKDNHPKYLKMKVVPDLQGDTIGHFMSSSVVKGSTIQSDAYHSYRKPMSDGYTHQYAVFDSDSDMLHWLHQAIANAKASIIGTFHGFDQKHLQCYLDAFCYRFNRRRFRNEIFSRLLSAVTKSHILGYAVLTR